MATIGMDKLYYALIREDENGYEMYSPPRPLAKAMQADLSVEIAEATLYADDAAAEVVKAFKSGTISLGVDDLEPGVAEALTGARIDQNGVLISCAEDNNTAVAIGFRAKRANGTYRYFWLYRVVFSIPSTSLVTKGDSISFSTPTIEGTVLRRNRPDSDGTHPWKAEVTEGMANPFAIEIWFREVYEPIYAYAMLSELSLGNAELSPSFDPGTTEYYAETTNATNTLSFEVMRYGGRVVPAQKGELLKTEPVVKNSYVSEREVYAEAEVNGNCVSSGDSITWNEGENLVEIYVYNGNIEGRYVIHVTKS